MFLICTAQLSRDGDQSWHRGLSDAGVLGAEVTEPRGTTALPFRHGELLHVIQFIQYSLFYGAQYHKLWIYLKGLYNLYTYDIPDLWPHIGSGKTPKKRKNPFHRENIVKKPSGEQQRRIPLQGGQKE